MWFLTKNQCCKKSQRQKIKWKVELQTVQQTPRKRELSSQRDLKGLTGQIRTPHVQMRWTRGCSWPLRWLVRVTVLPTKYGWEDDHVSITLVTETCDPSSYRESIEVDDHSKWITVMEQEMESLNRNQTWKSIDLSKNSKVIGCKWVFRKKDNERYETRLVTKGYAQKEDIDYNEFSLM